MPVRYRLVREPLPAPRTLTLDAGQERVAGHPGGPLLVLAGPGTGKTATLVEAAARRVEAGTDPATILLLTFSRRAAAELRERLALRLAGRTVAPTAWTFHAFCLSLLTQLRAEDGEPPPVLLTGPEQDAVIRELLRGDLEDRRPWPEPLAGVLDTRGLTEEVRALIARAQQLGLGSGDLRDIAGERADWRAVATFYETYQLSLEAQGRLDYAELVARAAAAAHRPEVRARLRDRFAAVFVDEYQDTDPLQERILQSVAGDGRDLVVVGDPDQAIYAFRGADVANILRFPQRFRGRDGRPAPVVALGVSRRSGPALVAAGRRIAAAIPVPAGFDHRELDARGPAGTVEVCTLPTAGAEAEYVAEVLRRAHLDDGLPWREMAVLVRSGRSLAQLRRSLGAAGVPVEVAADEVPLAAEPALAPLLLLVRSAADRALLTDERVRGLLLSPLVGADTAGLRRLGRDLRRVAREREPGLLPPSSATLVARAVEDPAVLGAVDPEVAQPVRFLVALLDAARAALEEGGGPAEALWAVWAASPWKRRLEALAGGRGRDSRAADRDLDAVVALFDAVRAEQERRPRIGVSGLLELLAAQQIPAGTQEERAPHREGVRLLTAHRSKGLEWDLVVVARVQESSWPDLRPRGSLLGADCLGPDGPIVAPERRSLLADERRLFYVACTRARSRLVLTAVENVADDGERPSRFLDDLGIEVVRRARRPDRPRTLAGLVAALRCEAVDPARPPEVRAAAAQRLARLAAARADNGQVLVPAADPAAWWGLAPRSAGVPLDPARPTPLSASTLDRIARCPLSWFFEHEARAERSTTPALGFGRVLHALADLLARGLLPAEEGALLGELDRVWAAVGYEVPWQRDNDREAARAAIRRLLAYLVADRGRTLVASEVPFQVDVDTEEGPVVVRGRMDRVERDGDGSLVVVDLKTGKTRPTKTELAESAQLAVYRYVVDKVFPGERAGGAELWHLRAGDTLTVQAWEPPPAGAGDLDGDDADGGTDAGADGGASLVARFAQARRTILAESFDATPAPDCPRCRFRVACPAQDDGAGIVA